MIRSNTFKLFPVLVTLIVIVSACSQTDEEVPVQEDVEITLPGILEMEEELVIHPKPYPPEVRSPWFQNPGFIPWNPGNRFSNPGTWAFPGGPGWLVVDGQTVYGFSEMPFESEFDPKDALWYRELPVYPQSPAIGDYSSLFFVLKGYGVMALDSRSGEIIWQRIIPDVDPKTPRIFRGMVQISIDSVGFDLLSTGDGRSLLSEPIGVTENHRFYGSDFLWVSRDTNQDLPWWVHQHMPQGFQTGSGKLYSLDYQFGDGGDLLGVELEPIVSDIIGGSPYPLGNGWLFFQRDSRLIKAISIRINEDDSGSDITGYAIQDEWELNVIDPELSITGVVYPQGSPEPGWPILVLGQEHEMEIVHGGVGISLGTLKPVEFQRLIPVVQRGLVQLTPLVIHDWIDERTFPVFWPRGFVGLRTPSAFFVPAQVSRGTRGVVYEKSDELPRFLNRESGENLSIDDGNGAFYVNRNQLPLEFWLTVDETRSYTFDSIRADRAPVRMIITLDGGTVYDNATHVRLESSAQLTFDGGRRYRVRLEWAGENESGDLSIAGISFSRSP